MGTLRVPFLQVAFSLREKKADQRHAVIAIQSRSLVARGFAVGLLLAEREGYLKSAVYSEAQNIGDRRQLSKLISRNLFRSGLDERNDVSSLSWRDSGRRRRALLCVRTTPGRFATASGCCRQKEERQLDAAGVLYPGIARWVSIRRRSGLAVRSWKHPGRDLQLHRIDRDSLRICGKKQSARLRYR